jgi:ribonuclease P protein component
MLARDYSLKGKKKFDKVLNEGKMFQSHAFAISVYDRKDDEKSHFGFIVSTKISKEAVQRNRIKRCLSEAIRYAMSEIRKGLDVVFLAKQESAKTSSEDLIREVKAILVKANLVK